MLQAKINAAIATITQKAEADLKAVLLDAARIVQPEGDLTLVLTHGVALVNGFKGVASLDGQPLKVSHLLEALQVIQSQIGVPVIEAIEAPVLLVEHAEEPG